MTRKWHLETVRKLSSEGSSPFQKRAKSLRAIVCGEMEEDKREWMLKFHLGDKDESEMHYGLHYTNSPTVISVSPCTKHSVFVFWKLSYILYHVTQSQTKSEIA